MLDWLQTPILWWHILVMWAVQLAITYGPRLFESKQQRVARLMRAYARDLARSR